MNYPHSTSASPGCGFDNYWVTDPPSEVQSPVLVIVQRAIGARHGGYTCFPHYFDGGNLISHLPNSFSLRTYECKPTVFYLLCKICILR